MKYLTKIKNLEVKKGKICIGLKMGYEDGVEEVGNIYEVVIDTRDSIPYQKFNTKKLYKLEMSKYKEFDTLEELTEYLDESGTSYEVVLIKDVRKKMVVNHEDEEFYFVDNDEEDFDPIKSFRNKILNKYTGGPSDPGEIVKNYLKK